MTRKKTPKKTDSLEVRLPHAVKQAFMARARSRGRSASSLVREFIDSYLAGTDPRTENRKMLRRIATPAALTSLVAAGIALHMPTAATAAPDLKALFDRFDRDGNGQLSAEEFVVRDGGSILSMLHDIDLGNMMALMIAHHSGADQSPHGPVPDHAVEMMRAAFAGQDSDGNGAVSFGEFESHHLGALRQAFDVIDADHDGGIDEGEFDGMMGRLPHHTAAHAKPFAELDGDASGTISWAEFLG
jgi:hypothetical protein